MKLRFRGDRHLVGVAQRNQTELWFGLLFGRFGDGIGQVTLRLSEDAEPGGHPEKRCQIDVRLRPRVVQVEHADQDFSVALDRAANKAVRSVARALLRERATTTKVR
jgi:hypothetical protein